MTEDTKDEKEVNPSLLEKQIGEYSTELTRPPGGSFKDCVRRIGDNITTAVLFQSMQTALGAYGAAQQVLRELNFQYDGNHRNTFLNAYAANVGAHLGRTVTNGYATDSAPTDLGLNPTFFNQSERSVAQQLISHHTGLQRQAQNGRHALALSQGFYQRLIEETERVLSDTRYAGLLQQQGAHPFVLTEPHSGRKLKFKELMITEEGNLKSEAIDPDLDLDSIAGNEEAKKVYRGIIAVRQDPDFGGLYGITVPNRILLYGPPGTGKTTMAQAFANEVGLPFHSASISDILSKWLGDAEKNMKEFLQRKGVLLLDEADSLGGAKNPEENKVYQNLVNILATEMDRIATDPQRILNLANNHGDWLDEKLVSRLDEKVYFPYPMTPEEHQAILAIHAQKQILRIKDPARQELARAQLDLKKIGQALHLRSEELSLQGGIRLAGRHIKTIVQNVHRKIPLEAYLNKTGEPRFADTQDYVAFIVDYQPETEDTPHPAGRTRTACR